MLLIMRRIVAAPRAAFGTSSFNRPSTCRVCFTSSETSECSSNSTPRSSRMVLQVVSTSSFAVPIANAGSSSTASFILSICRCISGASSCPNPPMDGMDGVRTAEGGEGVTGAMIRARTGRLGGGLQALWGHRSAYSGCGERDGGIGHGKRRSHCAGARPAGTFWLVGQWRTGESGPGNGSQSGQGAASSQGQRRGQGQSACRAGDPSGHTRRLTSWGHGLLTQADAGCPAPGYAPSNSCHRWGEARRRHVVQPDAVLEVASWRSRPRRGGDDRPPVPGLPIPVGDEAVIAVGGEESQLRTGRRLTRRTMSRTGEASGLVWKGV